MYTFAISVMCFLILSLASCSHDEVKTAVEPPKIDPEVISTEDNHDKIVLQGAYSEKLRTLLLNIKMNVLWPLGETAISVPELVEVKNVTDKIVREARATSEWDKHKAMFEWIGKHIKYKVDYNIATDGGDERAKPFNSAYRTFEGKEAICQGFANLLKVMCYTQGINAPVANGLLHFKKGDRGYGHAWNYVYLDGKWYMSDPTSRNKILELEKDEHIGLWEPERIDFLLSQTNEYDCMYTSGEITITKINSGAKSKYIVPHRVQGFVVTSFNPEYIPAHVHEILLHRDIQDIGLDDRRYLLRNSEHLTEIKVELDNPYLESDRGILYDKKRGNKILLVLPHIQVLRLKPFERIEKNVLYGLDNVREIYFAEGTERIEAYAVESCPKLEKVYLPKSIKYVDKEAFYRCPSNLKIIRQ